MPIKLKAALVTLVVGTCLANFAAILAYHQWLLPYLVFTISGGGLLSMVYLGVASYLINEEQRASETAEKARRVRA